MQGALPSNTKMREIYPWILALWFLKLCDGYEVTCTVSADARGVLYSVPEFEAKECRYSWVDENHVVLANYLDQDRELVVMQTNHTLLLKRCKLIHYRRNCLSEKGPFRGTCHAPCVASTDLIPQASRQTSWGLIASVLTVILVLVVGVALCFVFRARICRWSCLYSALKRPDFLKRRESMEEGIPF